MQNQEMCRFRPTVSADAHITPSEAWRNMTGPLTVWLATVFWTWVLGGFCFLPSGIAAGPTSTQTTKCRCSNIYSSWTGTPTTGPCTTDRSIVICGCHSMWLKMMWIFCLFKTLKNPERLKKDGQGGQPLSADCAQTTSPHFQRKGPWLVVDWWLCKYTVWFSVTFREAKE